MYKLKHCPHAKHGWCLRCVERLVNQACVVPHGFATNKYEPSNTEKLVVGFARALLVKLQKKEQKFGDSWMKQWGLECVRELCRHVMKGDPVDVAAYCAFCWHHHWSTTPPMNGYGDQGEKVIASAAPPPPSPITVAQATLLTEAFEMGKQAAEDKTCPKPK